MARRTRWTELRFGIVAVVAVLATAVLILVFGRVGQLHGKKFTLYVTTNAARGLIRGSEVWLDGQRVGSVMGIDFRPPTASPKERLVIGVHVLDEARLHIRRNSKVQLRSGSSLIGDPVVFLYSGTPDQPAVANGDTLRAVEQKDMEGVTSDAALAAREFPGIIENVKLLNAQLQSAQGTIGALGLDHGTLNLRPLRERTERFVAGLAESRGTVGAAIHTSTMWRNWAIATLASADSIQSLMKSDRHSLGRFRRDSTLAGDLRRARDDLTRLLDLTSSPNGTVGRLRADSAITVAIRRDRAALDSLMRDMKRRPLRYIAF